MKRGLFLIFCCCMVMVFCLGSAVAAPKKIEISLSCAMPDTHPVVVEFNKLIKEMEERSGGTMTGVVYPSAQMGGDVQVHHSILDHAVGMIWSTTASQVTFVPDLAIFDIPFLFANRQEAEKVFTDKEFMDIIGQKYEKAGFKLFGFDVTGFRWLSANRPVRKMEDLKGLKIRTMENPYHVAFWRALGVSPTPLANSERYTALQQGTVDGQENILENAYLTRLYEVQSDFMNTRHLVFLGVWVMDLQLWKEMSKEQQDLFTELLEKYRAQSTKDLNAREETIIKELREKYKKTIWEDLEPGEYERWRDTARPAAETLVRKAVGNELVDLLYKVRDKK
ncbi:putative Tripartite ATP-independent periplasmic transporter solute receptor, DctP family [uncultured delta proteobacterium]|uniref:Putative Tripartite ATP-independent periplasmic transporter solute receptor, DctP family n=1 Tax=uncultured delta proteobacterium TaxID=34034 RepID=A0A212JJN9_9DELT|nr:putative Tripartite ATP-independent periplasmic transporter solute receptor, DctP family [uncultured delta proteobacterium]